MNARNQVTPVTIIAKFSVTILSPNLAMIFSPKIMTFRISHTFRNKTKLNFLIFLRFQSLLKLLLWSKGVEWVKVLNALGPLCLWQCFFWCCSCFNLNLILSVRSDEEGCTLVVLDKGYNKIVPPFSIKGKLGSGGNIQPVPVNVSVKLLNILDVDEVDFSISFQFRITLQWFEYRTSYNNLKKNRYMNSFTQEDINKLWLPLLIY